MHTILADIMQVSWVPEEASGSFLKENSKNTLGNLVRREVIRPYFDMMMALFTLPN